MTAPLDRERVLRAFRLMADHLAAAGDRGELLIADGAVMAIVYDVERVTRDVDGVIIQGHGPVSDAARRVAQELHLPRGWLNEGVSAYLSTQLDPDTIPIFDHPNLGVMAVSPEHLLALKARAARAQDLSDLRTLCDSLQLTSTAEVDTIVSRFFPDDPLAPRARAVIDDLFSR